MITLWDSAESVLDIFAPFWPYSGQPENDLTQHMLQISFENRLLIYPKPV